MNFEINDGPKEGFIPIGELEKEKIEKIVNWQPHDYYVYKSPIIKLESICAAKGVYLQRPASNLPYIKNPYINENE